MIPRRLVVLETSSSLLLRILLENALAFIVSNWLWFYISSHV